MTVQTVLYYYTKDKELDGQEIIPSLLSAPTGSIVWVITKDNKQYYVSKSEDIIFTNVYERQLTLARL